MSVNLNRVALYLLLWFALCAGLGILLAGCAPWTYDLSCGNTKLHAESNGFAYIRSVEKVKMVTKDCGSVEVTGAQTDTEKAFDAGLKAAGNLAKDALKP